MSRCLEYGEALRVFAFLHQRQERYEVQFQDSIPLMVHEDLSQQYIVHHRCPEGSPLSAANSEIPPCRDMLCRCTQKLNQDHDQLSLPQISFSSCLAFLESPREVPSESASKMCFLTDNLLFFYVTCIVFLHPKATLQNDLRRRAACSSTLRV